MEKQNIIDGIRLIVIIGIFIFMVIGSYRNIINQNKVISTNTYIDKDNEIVNSNLEKEEVTNIEEKISDTDYKEYKEISKDDINEYDSITINNIQNENTYTDLINEKQSIDFEYFKSELLPNDYIEFMDEIKYINIIKSNSVTKSFKQLFEKIDEYKNELYQVDNVVNFRSKVTNDDTIKKIEEIFEEEFKDE